MQRKIGAIVAAAVVAAAPHVLLAADAPAPAPALPSLTALLTAWGVDLHGYVDASYSYLDNSGFFTSGDPDRVFDTEHDSFNLQQAAITIDYLPKDGFGGLVNLTAGRDARVIASYGEGSNNFDVTQAFAQYAHGTFTLIGGKFVTLAGAETINPTTDTNFSRSILFGFAIPFTHTGVRLTDAVSDKLSLIVGVNNGWDQLQSEQSQKTIEAGVAFTPNKIFSLSVQGYSGSTLVSGASNASSGVSYGSIVGRRDLLDAVATINVSSKLTFIINPDWGDQAQGGPAIVGGGRATATWYGVAGYANYQVSDQWAVSVRAESFDDRDGYRTGVAQTWSEGTADLRYIPNGFFEVRLEGRYDHTNGSNIVSDSVAYETSLSTYPYNGTAGTENHGYSFAVEGIAKF
ncbi:MAG TPA: outer membrane beta-barrel protein [Steroidobacteraceae bacterium]|nr:outer membrane beta-barrel protein [Steroidobacteraceae bacterium]